MKSINLFFQLYILLFPIFLNAQSEMNTPMELLAKAAELVEKRDVAGMRKIIHPADESSKELISHYISMLMLEPEIKSFVKKGEEKFGDQFGESLDKNAYFILEVFADYDFKTAIKSGYNMESKNVVHTPENENRALYRYSYRLPNGKTGNAKIPLKRVDGRWYLRFSLDQVNAPIEKFLTLAIQYILQGNTAVEKSGDSATLAKALGKILGGAQK